MKKLYLIILCIGACIPFATGETKILFKNAVRIGNNYENSGRFLTLNPEMNKISVSGVTIGNTDFGLSGIPRGINANSNQDMFISQFNYQLSNCDYAANLDGNGYDFINAVDVQRTNYKPLYGGHFNGTINILTKENMCGSGFGNCGFIAKSNNQGQFTEFQKFESTGSLTVRNLKWTKNDNFVVGINYSGSFTHGTNTVTSAGLTDAYIAHCKSLLEDPLWYFKLSAPGYEFIDAISYNDQSNEITATMSIDPLFSGPVTYTSSNGFTTTLTPTSYAYNNVIMIINADNGDLLDHTVIGSPSNYNIEGAFTLEGKTIIGGSANSELHPDQNNLSVTVPNNGGTDIVGLLYDGLHNFAKSSNLGGSGDDFVSKWEFKDRIKVVFTDSKYMLVAGGKSITGTKSASIHNSKEGNTDLLPSGALYILDDQLNHIDSILLDGTGISQIYDADMDSLGNLYITGDFSGTVDFDPSENSFNLTSSGGKDMFIAQYDASALFTTSIKPFQDNSLVKIYPVPAQDKFFIEANFKKSTSGKLQIQDISGRTILEESFANETLLRKQVPINLPSGLLFVKISTSKENIVKKLLVQR